MSTSNCTVAVALFDAYFESHLGKGCKLLAVAYATTQVPRADLLKEFNLSIAP